MVRIMKSYIEYIKENYIQNKKILVDERGFPITYYHGTKFKFDEFKPIKSKRTILLSTYDVISNAFFFTDDINFAKDFGSNIISANLQFSKMIQDNPDEAVDIIIDYYLEKYDGVIEMSNSILHLVDYYDSDTGLYNKRWISNRIIDQDGIDWMFLDEYELIERFKKAGFDGTFVWELEDDMISVAAFYNENIIRINDKH